ncbi:hypothetical protein [Methanosarcina sp. DH2]|nr:hypothetical protein [Methanosarcina sp. DH2]
MFPEASPIIEENFEKQVLWKRGLNGSKKKRSKEKIKKEKK